MRCVPPALAALQLDIIFTACFAVEMVLKLYAKGAVLHRQAYFRNGWDMCVACAQPGACRLLLCPEEHSHRKHSAAPFPRRFDGTIVITSIIALTPLAQQLTILRSLRLLRVLRPLRLLTQ